ncbi:MAG: TolB family protein [Planctomycetota bacterium]
MRKNTAIIITVSLAALFFVLAGLTYFWISADPDKAMRDLADGRKGYVVWESRRPSGTDTLKYRIWKRNLDGTGLEMISGQPDRADYSHIGPRISPDGRYVVFAGKKWNGYKDDRVQTLHGGEYAAGPFDAWIVEMDPESLEPRRVRELIELRGRVGTAGEDHIFEWKDAETLYVPLQEESAVYEVNARTGKIGRKVVETNGEMTVSPGGEYVLCAQGNGAGYARIKHDEQGIPRVGEFKELGGCQTNISFDNDFILWANRPGRIALMDLRNKKRHDLKGIKEALPESHDYIYFPAISRDMSVLAFGGGDEHNHAYADYEIFLVPWDKEANERSGPPVRYTFNDRDDYPDADPKAGHVMDRWPDVWVYNPRFAETNKAEAARTSDPLEDVESDLLAETIDQFDDNGSLQPFYRDLKEYRDDSDNPKKAREAKRILKHLNDWADQTLASAREAETGNAIEALELYRTVRDRYEGLSPGNTAQKRIDELKQDDDFSRELEAWSKLEKLREVADGFQVPDGAEASCEDPAFDSENSSRIKRFKKILSRMEKDYPNTRGMLEARSLARRYQVPMPDAETDGDVKATVVATVTRTSEQLQVEDVEPYTEALICTEYEVKEVISGECKKDRILAVQLAMSDGEELPPAEFEEGDTYRLELGNWEDQSHYHSHPIAQDIVDFDNPDEEMYFIFESTPVDGG